jgi:hypothetical protein
MKTNKTQVLFFAIAGGALIAVGSSALLAQEKSPKQPVKQWTKGFIAAPPGSETLNVALEAPSIQLFANANFKGTEATLSKLDNINPQGKANDMPKDLNDSVSSLRWSLPRGALVIFYEDAAPKGEQLVLWGSGQMAELTKWDFNDKASRWAWFNAGGGGTPLRGDATTVPPVGSESLGIALSDNTLQLFKDKGFGNDMKQISPVTSVRAGELQDIPSDIDDSLTAIQWNLPEGVIVMLYEDADGKKDRVAIWGKGQVSDLDGWDFNDKASRWSWAYIGEPTKSE